MTSFIATILNYALMFTSYLVRPRLVLPHLLARAVPMALRRAIIGVTRIAFQSLTLAIAGLIISRHALAVAAVTVLPATAIVFAIANPFVRLDLQYAHDRSSAAMLYDRKGQWLGVIPPNLFADYSDGKTLPPDHVAAVVTTAPPTWRACLIHLEDRSHNGLRYLGVDPVQIVKSAYQTMTGQRRRGASTLLMQVARTLQGRSPADDERPGDTLVRKVAELFGANALATMMATGDPQLADRYLAAHFPLITGTRGSQFGDPLHGVGIAAQILFGVEPDALEPEKQAVLAAAVNRPILLAPPSDEAGQRLALARFQRVKDRAAFCLRSIELDDATRVAALARLDALQLPSPRIEPDLAALLPADRREAWRILVNPIRRARYFAGDELRQIRSAISAYVEGDWRGRVASVSLTTSALDAVPFRARMKRTLANLQTSTRGLARDLVGRQRGTSANVFAILQGPDGRINRLYASDAGLLTRRIGVASTAKLAAAAVLGRTDSASSTYCNAPIPKTISVNAPIDPCKTVSGIDARTAFARSDSAALFWGMNTRPSVLAVANQIGEDLGLSVPGLSAATTLSLGLAEQTPAQQIRTAAALANGFIGRGNAVGLPNILGRLTLVDQHTGQLTDVAISPKDLIETEKVAQLFTPPARMFFKTVIDGVTQTGGTLAALAPLRARLGGLYAKTGTLSVDHSTQAVHISGFVIRGGEPWTFLISISADIKHAALGANLTAGQFAPLVELLLSDFARAPAMPRLSIR